MASLNPFRSKEPSERDAKILALAKEHLEREGKLEFDDDATVSEGDDNGAYVQAWAWVSFEGTEFNKVS